MLMLPSPRIHRTTFTLLKAPLATWGTLSNLHLVALVDGGGLLNADLTGVVLASELEREAGRVMELAMANLPDIFNLPIDLDPAMSWGGALDISERCHVHRYALVHPELSRDFLGIWELARLEGAFLAETEDIASVGAALSRKVWEILRAGEGAGIPLAQSAGTLGMELSA